MARLSKNHSNFRSVTDLRISSFVSREILTEISLGKAIWILKTVTKLQINSSRVLNLEKLRYDG